MIVVLFTSFAVFAAPGSGEFRGKLLMTNKDSPILMTHSQEGLPIVLGLDMKGVLSMKAYTFRNRYVKVKVNGLRKKIGRRYEGKVSGIELAYPPIL